MKSTAPALLTADLQGSSCYSRSGITRVTSQGFTLSTDLRGQNTLTWHARGSTPPLVIPLRTDTPMLELYNEIMVQGFVSELSRHCYFAT